MRDAAKALAIPLVLIVAALLMAATAPIASVVAGTQDAPATLTEVQKLTILTAVQKFEIAQLRAQAAQRELEALLKSLERPGYTLDLSTLTYTPTKPAAK